MIESRGINQIVHFIIGTSVLLIPVSLYFGVRPICVLACLGLGIFLVDYSLLPFAHLYQTFVHWLPILFELNILHGIYISSQIFHLSKLWSTLFLAIFILRVLMLIYSRALPADNHYRLLIEKKLRDLSAGFLHEATQVSTRLMQSFNQDHHQDDHELDKLKLQQIHSDEHTSKEHDETVQRFQDIAHQLASPDVSSMDCSHGSTPPIRRHHQRILQQSELDSLSRTPITPAHSNGSKGKILHSTINGSYTGPMTRTRTRTGPNASPVKSKCSHEFVSKRNEENQCQQSN